MKPGIYKMSFEDYKKIDAINNSKLVQASKTLAHALYEKDDTSAMTFGRDFHTYLLELDRFKKEYAIVPYGLKLTKKKGKAWLKENENKKILKTNDAITMIKMAQSLYSGNYETARNLIEKSEKEISIIWKHKTEGVLCKLRLDLLCRKLGIISDVKTSTNADPDKWFRTMLNAGIQPHFQPAWYLDGCKAMPELDINAFLWVVFETTEPFGISVIQATPPPLGEPDMVLLAQEQIKVLLPKYIHAKRTDEWMGYPDKIVHGTMPEYYIRSIKI